MSYPRRATALQRDLHDAGSKMDLLVINGRAEQIETAARLFEGIEESVKALTAALRPGASLVKWLQGDELWASLVATVVALVRDKGSERYLLRDLRDLVIDYSPERDLAFWHTQRAGLIHGLLAFEPDVQKGLAAEGVLAWEEELDREWRIVNTRWLEAHAEIRKWVTLQWPGGRICRFCGITENPHLNTLIPVQLERRGGLTRIGDIVALPAGGTLTHDQCRPFWLQWLELASSYATPEAAEAADAAAGRPSRGSAMPRLEPPARDLPDEAESA
jgi:hypothetical protein